jgi:membrane-associated phospholipid phosphatase
MALLDRLQEGLLDGPVTPVVRLVSGGVCLALFFGVYGAIGASAAASPTTKHVLPTAVDALVPLCPEATLAYLALFPLVLMPLFLASDRRVLARGALAYFLMLAVSVPIWILAPVTVPRSPVPVVDLFTWGLALTRWIDPPTNCFPSMHVAEAFCAALVTSRLDRAVGRVMLVGASLIWWSTLALDQHWFVDGAVGLLIAVGVERLVFGWRPLPPAALRPEARARVAWAVGIYVVLVLICALPWWTGAVDPAALQRDW